MQAVIFRCFKFDICNSQRASESRKLKCFRLKFTSLRHHATLVTAATTVRHVFATRVIAFNLAAVNGCHARSADLTFCD